MKYGIVFTGLALACGLGSPAYAANTEATLSAAEDNVMINQGAQFVPAQVGNLLAAGDRVMVAQGRAAEVTFNDGCKLKVQPGTVVTIPSASTCKGGVALVQSTNPGQTGALGASAGAEPPFALGIAALAVAGYVVVHNANASDRPLSP